MFSRASSVITRRVSPMISTPMKHCNRHHFVAVHNVRKLSLLSNNLAVNHYCDTTNYYNPQMTNIISSRTMSSKPAFSWEEKRVEVTAPEEFQRRLNRIKRLSDEAQSCIRDVKDSLGTDYFEEEFQCAEMAVGNAGTAYSELLEELAITNEGVQLLNEVRKVVAPAIESLREELRHIGTLKNEEE